MTENKAQKLLQEYLDAELKGDDALADQLETQLNNAGWKITVGPDGYNVIRENGGLFSGNDSENNDSLFFPRENYVSPYSGTNKSTSSNLPMIIGISIVAVLGIVAIIAIVKVLKKRKDAVAGQL